MQIPQQFKHFKHGDTDCRKYRGQPNKAGSFTSTIILYLCGSSPTQALKPEDINPSVVNRSPGTGEGQVSIRLTDQEIQTHGVPKMPDCNNTN